MTTNASFVVVGAVGMLISMAPGAHAQWRVDLSGGALVDRWAVHLPNSALGHSPDLHQPGDARFDTGGTYALGASYVLSNHFEVGGQFQHSLSRQVDRLTIPTRFPETVPKGLTAKPALDVFSVTAGTRVHLLPQDRRVRPWLIGQVGWYRARAEVTELLGPAQLPCGAPINCFPVGTLRIRRSGGDDGFGFNVGGGVDVALTRLLSVGADVRYHRAVNVLENVDFVTTMVSLGLRF